MCQSDLQIMKHQQSQYIAIDLKSFYASVECVERGLNPLDACLVVADPSRTSKTICLAVSAGLKSFGIGGRPRLFEVEQTVRQANRLRGLSGKSQSMSELNRNNGLAIDYIVAPPRMGLYIEYSARIYQVYLRYIAPEDIFVYSVDEVFIDVGPYLQSMKMTASELGARIAREIFFETGVTATVGVGTNLYLCKIAMDIVAKKQSADANGVRLAELDEMTYRRLLWTHRPLTDFWRVGRGIARRLEAYGLLTMGDIARCSLENEDLLYRLLGVNAELLIDHAWGWEPLTLAQIRAYTPSTHSLSSGQVLSRPYNAAEARIVAREMADNLSLKLIDKRLMTNRIVLTVGYDVDNLASPQAREAYGGQVKTDFYGRSVPVHSQGTARLDFPTSSGRLISDSVAGLFDRIVNKNLTIRRLTIATLGLTDEASAATAHNSFLPSEPVQLELFVDYDALRQQRREEEMRLQRERRCQEAILKIKKTYGKNAILRGLNYADGATQRERNSQIGGHKA